MTEINEYKNKFTYHKAYEKQNEAFQRNYSFFAITKYDAWMHTHIKIKSYKSIDDRRNRNHGRENNCNEYKKRDLGVVRVGPM